LEGEKIVEICQKGDKLLEEEIGKVYKGKKIVKGWSNPVTAQSVAEEPHKLIITCKLRYLSPHDCLP
jgi:hypothetical protein